MLKFSKYYKTKIPKISMKEVSGKKGQVWVETVLYTLIAFALIGLVLGFAKPKIQELQDKTVIEQSIGIMEDIDLVFTEIIQGGFGNKRLIEIGIRKGSLKIDGITDEIIFEIEGKYTYSEPGLDIQQGNLIIHSEEKGKISFVNISRDYSIYNITYQEEDVSKIISKATTSYKLVISNQGKDAQDKTIINIELN